MRAYLAIALAFGVLAVGGIAYWAWFVRVVNHENDSIDAFFVGFAAGVIALAMWVFSRVDSDLGERSQKIADSRVPNEGLPWF